MADTGTTLTVVIPPIPIALCLKAVLTPVAVVVYVVAAGRLRPLIDPRIYVCIGVITVAAVAAHISVLDVTVAIVIGAAYAVATLPVRAVCALVTLRVSAVDKVVAVIVDVVVAYLPLTRVYIGVCVIAVNTTAPCRVESVAVVVCAVYSHTLIPIRTFVPLARACTARCSVVATSRAATYLPGGAATKFTKTHTHVAL